MFELREKQTNKRGVRHYHKINLKLISEYTGIPVSTLKNKQSRGEVDFHDLDQCIQFMAAYAMIKNIKHGVVRKADPFSESKEKTKTRKLRQYTKNEKVSEDDAHTVQMKKLHPDWFS